MSDDETQEKVVTSERIVTVTRRLKLTTRKCRAPGCDEEFMGWGRQRYCSRRCAVRADYHNHIVERRAARRNRYKGTR